MKTTVFRLLSVDVEKNGLHGPVFAVGAVLLSQDGEIQDQFRARCPIEGAPRDFVVREILPALADYVQTHDDPTSMRQAFWEWFRGAREGAVVFADFGWPSEARFFLALAEDAIEERYLQGPYPLHEVSTLLLAAGEDPDISRERYAGDLIQGRPGMKHDPWWDARASVIA